MNPCVLFLHPQGQQTLYLAFEIHYTVPVAAPVWMATIPILVVSFIVSTRSLLVSLVGPLLTTFYKSVGEANMYVRFGYVPLTI